GAGGPEEDLGQILEMLLAATNVDFSVYKTSTVRRRVRRRMSGQQIAELGDYLRYLQEHPSETLALYNDLLVGVTELFRDPDVFEELKASVFTELLQNRHPGRPIRIWVPGCSRGDEAYTIAICALEAMGSRREPVRVQLFATDLKEGALTQARTGRY